MMIGEIMLLKHLFNGFLLILLVGCASTKISENNDDALLVTNAPQTPHYALLLPTSGSLASHGDAVHHGFLAAFYETRQNMQPSALTLYNTASNPSIISLYQKALSDGATQIIGPLDKVSVEALAHKSSIPVVTLALNYSDKPKNLPTNFYEFGLSPLDEAEFVAARAKQDGFKRVLIIRQRGNWGMRTADAFAKLWRKQGGKVTNTIIITHQQTIIDKIQNALNINTSKGAKSPEEIQPKPNFDMVFLIADPAKARAIVPLFKFYGAEFIPIYATSSVYAGTPQPQNDKDLNGVKFCDFPGFLSNSDEAQKFRNQFVLLWPQHSAEIRLYALGIDAYHVLERLKNLDTTPYEGLTGTLTLKNHRIKRQLMWAQFQNGVVELIP